MERKLSALKKQAADALGQDVCLWVRIATTCGSFPCGYYGVADTREANDVPLNLLYGSGNMADWKTERDALVSETMAFVQVVRSQEPVSAERIIAPMQVLADVLTHSREVASPVPERAQPTFDETVELQPMKRNLELDREEIRQRVANFKEHQQRLIREREDYARSTLMRMQASLDAVADPPLPDPSPA